MHNRKKLDRPLSEEETRVAKEKSATYKGLVGVIWKKRAEKDYSKDTLLVLGKMLAMNPDFYSLWNYRREILLSLHPELDGVDILSSKVDNPALLKQELDVTAAAIRRNPKSYGAWSHRLWTVERVTIDFESELEVTKDFLKQDQRNFHCWNYRREIFRKSGIPLENELSFSLEKIQENFSNYSAFHHRSHYLQQSDHSPEIFSSEWSIVENAIFTEPDDQSGWWYYQFLLSWTWNRIESESDLNKQSSLLEWFGGEIANQFSSIESLLEAEPNSRWCMICLVHILDFANDHNLTKYLPLQDTTRREKRSVLIENLIRIDPIHANRYNYLLNKE